MSKKLKIVNQAMRLFAEKGYTNASIAELAKLTQVAEGTIYYHFKTKETLFQSVLEDIEHTLIREFQNFFKERHFTSGMEKIEQSIFFYFYLVGTREEMFLILHRYDAYEMAQINPIFREHFSKIYSFLLDTIQEAIISGHRDGSIGDMDAGKSAFIIYAMVDGVARLKTFNLYDSSALYEHLILSCRNMLKP